MSNGNFNIDTTSKIAHDRSPIGDAKRTVYYDINGNAYYVEWELANESHNGSFAHGESFPKVPSEVSAAANAILSQLINLMQEYLRSGHHLGIGIMIQSIPTKELVASQGS